MVRLPVVSGAGVVKFLVKRGFVHMRTKGSHAILKKEGKEGKTVVPVPLHKELAPGTLLSILEQAGCTKEELVEAL